jgi:hypothetical protein
MKSAPFAILFLFFIESCTWGSSKDAYTWLTWTIDGYAADTVTCAAAGGRQVVIEEDPYGDGLVRWRMSFACADGEGMTDYHFESWNTVYLRFRLIGEDNAIVSESQWQIFTPYPGENDFEVDFETTRNPEADAAVELEWTIDDRPAGAAACGSVGADKVRIEHDEDGDASADWVFDFPCPAGRGTTDYHFESGTYASVRFLLLGQSEVLSLTDWDAMLMQRGVNPVTVDFNTSVAPPDTASVSFTWSIHFVPGGTEICGWAGAAAVRLMLDADDDGTEDDHFDFDCREGSGATGEAFEPGQVIHFAFALLDASAAPISRTSGWEARTLAAGPNNLGSVNFIVGDYGPLGVELQWGNAVGEDASFGACDFPPETVSNIGYLLRESDGSIVDSVDIDTAPLDCAQALRWDVLDYGTYELVVDGEDAGATAIWGATCADLVVDDYETESNEFTCNIAMTQSP